VLHLVAAVADPDRQGARLADGRARPLVVEDAEGYLRRERALLDEHPPELGLAAAHQLPDEVLLDVDVLVEELAETLLVDVAPQPHHRELEEPGHGRGQHVDRGAVPLQVEEDRPRGEAVQNLSRLRLGNRPGAGRRLHPERLDRQARDELGLSRREEDLQDLVEELGRRSPLRTAVEPLHEAAVSRAGGEVGHDRLRRTTPKLDQSCVRCQWCMSIMPIRRGRGCERAP
jgi:hypothetical protein